MDKDEFKKLTNNPNNIPGIYNYCDRWCERCAFTTRCLNYTLSEKQFGNEEERDLTNKKFWENLSDILNLTLELIKEDAERLGIDLNDLEETSIQNDIEKLFADTEENPCVKISYNYMLKVADWFDTSGDLFDNKKQQLIKEYELDLPEENILNDALTINDSLEIILWYHTQINVKLHRAVSSKIEEEKEDESDYPKDSDGSAKVALIGIDRSIAAWGKLLNHFSEQEDTIYEMIMTLINLRKTVEKEFPEARKFKRIGFDD